MMGGEFDEADDGVHDVITAFCEGVGARGDVFEVKVPSGNLEQKTQPVPVRQRSMKH